MNREQLMGLHAATCTAAYNTMQAKNHDYASSEDPFQNFRGSTSFEIHPVVGILLRMQDKLQRINTFARKGTLQVKGESVDDAIEDIINYAVLAKAMCNTDVRQYPGMIKQASPVDDRFVRFFGADNSDLYRDMPSGPMGPVSDRIKMMVTQELAREDHSKVMPPRSWNR